MALKLPVGPWSLFQFLDPIHSRKDSLDGGSARRKASTYIQYNKNRINAHNTDIHALSGFDPMIPVFERARKMAIHRLQIINWKGNGYNGRDHLMVDLLFKHFLGWNQEKHENLHTKIRIKAPLSTV
jgi:hypothetical protein